MKRENAALRPPTRVFADVPEFDDLAWRFSIRLWRHGRWLPWNASITHGIGKLGEPGSSTYASRTPERALEKALRTVTRIAARGRHLDRVVIEIEGWDE